MHAALFFVVSATLGVDVGWQPLKDGGFEYIIQIEPQSLELLRNGDELRSDIPPFLRDVRSYRIRAGSGELPRIGVPSQAADSPTAENGSVEPSAAAAGTAASDNELNESTGDRYSPTATPDAGSPSSGSDEPVRAPRNEPRYPNRTPLSNRSMAPSSSASVGDRTSGDAADAPPRILEPDPSSTELVGHESSYREGLADAQPEGPSADKSTNHDAPPAEEKEAPKRWWPLTGALLMLFVSVGGNAYLGMQWWSVRQRCQDLMRQLRGGPSPIGAPGDPATDGASDEDEDADVRIVSDSAASSRKSQR